METEKKILHGHIARVQRRVNKIMKEQMDILKQVYKLDNKIDKLTWDLTLSTDIDLSTEKQALEDKLAKLMQQKYKNNDLLKLQEDKANQYQSKLTSLEFTS